MDLYAYLALQHLDRSLNAASAADRELAAQEMELFVTPEDEFRLIRAYAELEETELETISPDVHEWFLERIALAGALVADERVGLQIARVFLLHPGGTLAYLAVQAAVQTRRMEILRLLNARRRAEEITAQEADQAALTLVQCLLDIYLHRNGDGAVLGWLAEILSAFGEATGEEIRSYAVQIGPELGNALKDLGIGG